jgi:hypothetical protein
VRRFAWLLTVSATPGWSCGSRSRAVFGAVRAVWLLLSHSPGEVEEVSFGAIGVRLVEWCVASNGLLKGSTALGGVWRLVRCVPVCFGLFRFVPFVRAGSVPL